MDLQRIGGYAFIIGALLAVLLGVLMWFMPELLASSYVVLALVVLGLIVGFINIEDKDLQKFLLAAVALMVVGSANLSAISTVPALEPIGAIIVNIVRNVAVFVAPAALVVALKAVYVFASIPTKKF